MLPVLDSLAQNDFLSLPTIYATGETLSGGPVPRNNIGMSALFGNGGAALAIIPGQEISLIHPDLIQAVVKKDTKNVIQLPRVYEVKDYEQNRLSAPYWYKVDENALESFIFGVGTVMNTMTTQGYLANMNGVRTGLEFKNLFIQLGSEMLKRYYQLFPDKKITLGLFHQPSKIILDNVAKKLAQKYPDIKVPWLMTSTGFNNVSSATFPIALMEAILQNIIKSDQDILVGTVGIGLSGHAGVIRFRF